MSTPCEYTLVEKPIIYRLASLGYDYLQPEDHDWHRDGENHVILRPHLIQAIQRINGTTHLAWVVLTMQGLPPADEADDENRHFSKEGLSLALPVP